MLFWTKRCTCCTICTESVNDVLYGRWNSKSIIWNVSIKHQFWSLFTLNLILPFSSHWNCESYLSTKASILTFRACMSVHFTLHYNFLWPPIKVSIGLWIQAMMCGFQLECIPISAVIWYPRGRYSFEFKSFTFSKHSKTQL